MKIPLLPLLLVLLLSACSTPQSKPAPAKAAAKPTAQPAASKTKTASTESADGTQLVCTDSSDTGSNIRHRHCERLTEEQRRQRQEQVDTLMRSSGANAAKPSGIQ